MRNNFNLIAQLMIALPLVLGASGTRADPIELTLAHNGGSGSLYEISANEFARRANERLEGRAHVTVAGNSAFGDDTAVMEKLKTGTVAFALPASVMSSVDDVFGVFEMPFLIRNRAHMARIRSEMFDRVFQPAAQRNGYRILGVWELGFRHITNNLRPIRYPEDLKGLKLRVPKGFWRARMFAAYGAITVPIPLDETLKAIQSGTVDGQENPIQQTMGAHLEASQKYLTLSYHLYSPAFLTVSEEHFKRLPADVQNILTRTALELETFSRDKGEELDRNLLEKLRGTMTINEIDLVEFFHEAAVGIYREFAANVAGGDALVQKMEALAAGER